MTEQISPADPPIPEANAAREQGTHTAGIPASVLPVTDRFTLFEVAQHLQESPETLRDWRRRFGPFLSSDGAQAEGDWPTFTQDDFAMLHSVRFLIGQGWGDAQIGASLHRPSSEAAQMAVEASVDNSSPAVLAATTPAAPVPVEQSSLAPGAGHAIDDLLGAIAGSQQAVLNGQASMREMLSVVVQDNFNLKEENRKLRERMLEMERVLAEFQRREETRKDRMEARMRALEGTMAALQQQMAQFVQLQRSQQRRRGFWW